MPVTPRVSFDQFIVLRMDLITAPYHGERLAHFMLLSRNQTPQLLDAQERLRGPLITSVRRCVVVRASLRRRTAIATNGWPKRASLLMTTLRNDAFGTYNCTFNFDELGSFPGTWPRETSGLPPSMSHTCILPQFPFNVRCMPESVSDITLTDTDFVTKDLYNPTISCR
jgi:hypothetical protein